MDLDVRLLYLLNDAASRSPFASALCVFFASYLPFLLVGWFLLWLWRSRAYPTLREKAAFTLSAFAAALLARGTATIIRFIHPRPRPFIAHAIHPLFIDNASSFPSGHATFFFGFATLIYMYDRRMGAVALIASALIVVARVAAGVHYPSDILAGAVIGVLWGWLTFRYIRPLLDTAVRRFVTARS